MCERAEELTVLLKRANQGDEAAGNELFALVQQKLHQMAERKLGQEQAGATIQATVLVDDAFLQLVGETAQIDWNDRRHFYVMAAKVMRRILVDRARRRKAVKRGGKEGQRADIEIDAVASGGEPDEELLALHEALKSLGQLDPRQAKIVELRHFGGYSLEETANLLEVSPSTVKQEFAAAKAWLYRQLSRN